MGLSLVILCVFDRIAAIKADNERLNAELIAIRDSIEKKLKSKQTYEEENSQPKKKLSMPTKNIPGLIHGVTHLGIMTGIMWNIGSFFMVGGLAGGLAWWFECPSCNLWLHG